MLVVEVRQRPLEDEEGRKDGREEGRKEGRRQLTLKSNNPHLAGGEQNIQTYAKNIPTYTTTSQAYIPKTSQNTPKYSQKHPKIEVPICSNMSPPQPNNVPEIPPIPSGGSGDGLQGVAVEEDLFGFDGLDQIDHLLGNKIGDFMVDYEQLCKYT